MAQKSVETNWSGNYSYRAGIVHPSSIAELQALIAAASADAPLRALGTRHTFNDLVDPGETGTLVSLTGLPRVIEIDAQRRLVRVSAGLRYGDVALELEAAGWALGNLASLPHISIAGAVATATHGSGVGNGNLASAVASLSFVDGTGTIVRLARGDADFAGAVVAIGALGFVTELELDIVPSFRIAQTVARALPWESVPDALSSAYSVSVFTTWDEPTADQLWIKSTDATALAGAEPALFGATASPVKMHPIARESAEACTEQLGVPGPWHERLPHFRLDFTPSSGEEIQSEFLFPRGRTAEAIEAMRAIGPVVAPLLLISEIRTIAADGLWLSTASSTGEDERAEGATAFHFTWRRDQAGVEAVLPAVESALAPFGARPHWGKLFVDGDREVLGRYPRLAEFRELRARHDPRGLFANDFTRRLGF